MNFELSKEIFGANPWFVDQNTLPALMTILENAKNGNNLELPETKYNTPYLLSVDSQNKLITRPYQLSSDEDFTGIGVININGPITVGGGASTMGMRQVSSLMLQLNRDSRIKNFIVLGDSGGGSSAAVEIMVDAINEVKETKKVFGLVRKGGIAASAMYGIISATNEIYAESGMSIVGSAGTMMQFEGRPANSEKDGIKYIRLYAPESTKKNEGFEEAINNDNYKILQDDLLKPINDGFLEMISINRPALVGTDFRNGNTKFAKDSIGTFIDGIKSFKEVVGLAVAAAPKVNNTATKTNNNFKTENVMTVQDLKQQHPETYNAIFNSGVTEGVSNEKDRAGAWMAHSDADPEAVKAGVDSGLEISATQTQELLVKANSIAYIESLKTDSKKEVKVSEATAKEVADNAEELAFEAKLDEALNIKND